MLNGEAERGETVTTAGEICGELAGGGGGMDAREEEREGMTGAMNCCWRERGLGTRMASSPGAGVSTSQWSSPDGLGTMRESSRGWIDGEWWANEPWWADMASCKKDQRKGLAVSWIRTCLVNDGLRCRIDVPPERNHPRWLLFVATEELLQLHSGLKDTTL